MNYSKITSTSIIKNQVRIDVPTIFICIPDSDISIAKEIYNTNFVLTNCNGLIVPNKLVTIEKKKFNGQIYFNDVKKQMTETPDTFKASKKLKVLSLINIMDGGSEQEEPGKKLTPGNILDKENKFYFYDGTLISQACEYVNNKINSRMAMFVLMREINNLYSGLKSVKPNINVDVVLLMKNNTGILHQFFNNILTLMNNKDIADKMVVFDNFMFVNNLNNTLIPVLNKDNAKINMIKGNINKIPIILSDEVEEEPQPPVNKEEEKKKEEEPIKDIVSTTKTETVTKITKTNPVPIKLNTEALRKVLDTYHINDPDIVANVKSAIDTYSKISGEKPTKENAEHIALKAINYTVHGNDIVKEDYLNNPVLLINKIKDINTYKVPLEFPKMDHFIDPKHVVDIEYTTGQHRQKFEFEETIHENVRKLFSSVEGVTNNPIKVLNMKWDVKDDNSDRYIDYTVTLQNTNGGFKEPYDVNLKVPAPINDRYFKLHGSNYIISSQHFLKPLTKTDKNEVRILSNYAIVRLSIQNLKFNPSDVEDLKNYIKLKYPTLIKNVSNENIEFADGDTVYFVGDKIVTGKTVNLRLDEETNKIVNQDNIPISSGRYEFIFEFILSKIQSINPEDNLTRSKKSIPYFQLYLGKIKIPLIYYLWSQKGLLHTLNDFGIDYEVTDSVEVGDTTSVPMVNGKFLVIKPKSMKDKLLVNGILAIKIKEPVANVDKMDSIYPLLLSLYGPKGIAIINLMTENEIDPITKELLEFERMPVNLPALISGPTIDKLLNGNLESLSDLNIYRARLSEVVLQTTYKQIKMAHNHYRSKINRFDDQNAKIVIDPDYVIKELLTDAGFLQNTNPVTPIEELMLASRVIKSGKGGKRMPHYIVMYN